MLLPNINFKKNSLILILKKKLFLVSGKAWLAYLSNTKMEAFDFKLRFLLICVALIFLIVHQTSACGGGSSSCSWQTCSETWTGYSPNPSRGGCVWQYNRVSHHYASHSQGSGCPSSTSCHSRDQSRIMCKWYIFIRILSLLQ